MDNTIPAIASDAPIFLESAEFPTDRVLIRFAGPSPNVPGILHLDFSLLNTNISTESVRIPPNTDPATLMEIAAGMAPPGITALRGDSKGPHRNSVLWIAPAGNRFTGFRMYVEPEIVQPDPSFVRHSGAYWGEIDARQTARI